MTVTFNLNYNTTWGQELHVSGSCRSLGSSDEDKSIPMVYVGSGGWTLSIDLDDDEPFTYCYLLKYNGRVVRNEYGKPRAHTPSKGRSYKLFDCWRDIPMDKNLFSLPFTEVFYSHTDTTYKPKEYSKTLKIKVFSPAIAPNHKVGLVGQSVGLGDWDASKAIELRCPNFPEWELTVDATKVSLPLEFKFVILDEDGSVICWEEGINRSIYIPPLVKNDVVVISDLHLNNPLPRFKGAGVSIPLFSLRSDRGCGIGEMPDLKLLADWASEAGMRFIQILPINDTTVTKTWVDTYPYKSISIFALNPIYLSLEGLGRLEQKDEMALLDSERSQLNALEDIDYERVFAIKWAYFRKIFAQEGEATLASKEFKQFFERNKGWLVPYAAFCHLRDKFGTADFSRWGKYATYQPELVAKLSKRGCAAYNDIALSYYLQYHLHLQLTDAHDYAHQKGVAFKGDIPIGISRYSTEAWTDPQLFCMNGQAGAPPDDFSALGQNWGFPTYHWSEMAKDGYQWWKLRMAKMADYFDAYRIDHILGFFRIWEIPISSVQGLLGCFSPALPYSRDEVHAFGLYFNDDRFLKPFIRERYLPDFFGEYAQEAADKFLEERGFGIYDLLPDFDTQQKVASYFEGKCDSKSEQLKNGLFGLINEVLFIRDPEDTFRFHPRISAQFTKSYLELSTDEKYAFDRLYNHFFYERHTEFWKQEALKKLPALSSATDMLVCGEDLGMIPDSVPDVMSWLQILSLEIQRMPKDPRVLFADTFKYPYNSVCTTSTHDMSTIRGWWEEDRARTQRFYNEVLHEHGEAPYFCEPWICERIIDQHLAAPSMLCILPLQDWLGMDVALRRLNPADERINVPANATHYWRYRMHLKLETLLESSHFSQRIAQKVRYYGR